MGCFSHYQFENPISWTHTVHQSPSHQLMERNLEVAITLSAIETLYQIIKGTVIVDSHRFVQLGDWPVLTETIHKIKDQRLIIQFWKIQLRIPSVRSNLYSILGLRLWIPSDDSIFVLPSRRNMISYMLMNLYCWWGVD